MWEQYFGKWYDVIDHKELLIITSILEKEYNSSKFITPDQKNVFNCFHECKYGELKVVFLGQDPYPQGDRISNNRVATGLAFGNNINQDPISPSLRVIRNALLQNNVFNDYDLDITLKEWANQGILLLNSALTVEVNKVGSHTIMWRPFISSLLSNLSKNKTGIIYVLFGDTAKSFKPYIDYRFNYIIERPHPAYLARINKELDSGLFGEINELLRKQDKEMIDWIM